MLDFHCLLGTSAFAGFSFLVFYGQYLAGASGSIIASVMMATQPLLRVLVARVWRKVVALISMLVAVIGVLLVVTNGDLSILSSGDNLLFATVLILLGVFCWVIYSAVGANFGHWSILRFLALSTLLGMVSVYIYNFDRLAESTKFVYAKRNFTGVSLYGHTCRNCFHLELWESLSRSN